MLQIWKNTGTEGTRYDPYQYEELVVEKDQTIITYHIGLAEWLTIKRKSQSGESVRINSDPRDEEYLPRLFEMFTRISPKQFQKYDRRINGPRGKCPTCGSKNFDTFSGYPGEEFNVCNRCGTFVNSYFNKSEIV